MLWSVLVFARQFNKSLSICVAQGLNSLSDILRLVSSIGLYMRWCKTEICPQVICTQISKSIMFASPSIFSQDINKILKPKLDQICFFGDEVLIWYKKSLLEYTGISCTFQDMRSICKNKLKQFNTTECIAYEPFNTIHKFLSHVIALASICIFCKRYVFLVDETCFCFDYTISSR